MFEFDEPKVPEDMPDMVSDDESRVAYIHEYTKKALLDNESSITLSTAKLSLVLLCSVILVGTSSDIQSALPMLPSALCAIAGMLPGARLGATPPDALMCHREEGMTAKNLQLIVTKTWIDELDGHSVFRDKKAKLANLSLLLLGVAIVGHCLLIL